MKEVSQAAQEAKLDRELLRFEQELELFTADKDLFLEELYRRLKQITSLWRSWRCQRLRSATITQLVSTKQVNRKTSCKQFVCLLLVTTCSQREKGVTIGHFRVAQRTGASRFQILTKQ